MSETPDHPAIVSDGADSVLDDLIEGLTARLQAGELVDLDEVARRHPEQAERLRRLLPALVMMADFGDSPPRELEGVDASGPGPGAGVLGDFRIVREVGRGGMGIVYEAQQLSLDRRVALKVLPLAAAMDGKQLQRFQLEAHAAACLHHTNIVPVHAVGCERGVPFYAMQFIEGRSLAQAIAELRRLEGLDRADEMPTTVAETKNSTPAARPASGGAPPPVAPASPAEPGPEAGPGRDRTPRAADTVGPTAPAPGPGDAPASGTPTRAREYIRTVAGFGVQVAEALDHAHTRGILHRDIKPGNLLLDDQGQLWVTDFGLAQVQGHPALTLSGDILGTLRYMSPEQALGKRVVIDGRTDVYSLGVTLYELLALRPAIEGQDRQEILRKIAQEEPGSPRKFNPAVPRDLETIVLKAMAKEPGERYATARELADELRRFLDHKPITARRPSLLDRAAKSARRYRAAVAAGSAGLLVAVAILAGSIGWIVRDRAERLAITEREANRSLGEAIALRARSKWPEALEAVKRAGGLLAGGGGEPLRQQVQEVRRDLEMVLRLEDIRMLAVAPETPTDGIGQALDYADTDGEYARAFREYGIDIDALPPQEASRRVAGRAICQELVAALDNWVTCRALGRRRGDVDGLIAVARAADPDELRNRLRDLYYRPRAEWDALLNHLPTAVRHHPLSATSLDVLGHVLVSTGRVEQALGVLQEAQRRYPGDFWVNFRLGFCHSRLHTRWDEAIRFYSVARGLRPDCVFLLDHMGNALRAAGRLDEAMDCFREAIRLKPDYASGHYGVGNVLLEKGQLNEAIVGYRRILRLDPNYAWARFHIGRALEKGGKVDECIDEYRAAIRLKPDLAAAHVALGRVLRGKGLLPPTSQRVRERWRREMRSRAEALKVSRIEEGRPAAVELLPGPLLRYSDPNRATDDAALWAWGRGGRPVVLVAMEFSPLDEGWATGTYEFASLADGPIRAEASAGRRHWLSRQPAVTLQEFGSAPADAEPERLEQMKGLVRRMAARSDGGRVELRVSPGPIHRYADPAAGVLDGAIFAFTDGDNPEIVLLIEARRRGEVGPRWHHGLARLSGASLSVSLDGKEVWRREASDGLRPEDGYGIIGEPYPPAG
jgi:serine/threonine protein kinase/cytochrome c-type biogenesis protein CcmH/NrfG